MPQSFINTTNVSKYYFIYDCDKYRGLNNQNQNKTQGPQLSKLKTLFALAGLGA